MLTAAAAASTWCAVGPHGKPRGEYPPDLDAAICLPREQIRAGQAAVASARSNAPGRCIQTSQATGPQLDPRGPARRARAPRELSSGGQALAPAARP